MRREPTDLAVIKAILGRGTSVNEIMFESDPVSYQHFRDFNLGTVLHQAAADGNAILVKFLLQNGADMGVRDSCGKLPIDRAISRGHEKVATILRAAVGYPSANL